MSDVDLREVDGIVTAHRGRPGELIAILQGLQERYQHLPEEALRRVSETTDLSLAQLMGVATFYAQFRLRPAGRHAIKVCVGTACHVMGAERIYDALCEHLRIPEGDDTDPERLFTVHRVACLGCCMLAPAVQVDDVTYGFVKPAGVPGLVADFLARRQEEEAPAAAAAAQDSASEVRLCLCSSCAAAGAPAVFAEIRRQVHDLALPVSVRTVACTGMAYQTPLIEVDTGNGRHFRYGRVRPEEVRELLLGHFRPARLMTRIRLGVERSIERLYTDQAWDVRGRRVVDPEVGPDAAFVAPQHHLATERCGELTPLDLDQYRRHGGFEALRQCLDGLAPEEVIVRLEGSGLRGRGGAGFPTARKWAVVRAAAGSERYVVCNGDEGDPGAFMDRMILESFPFRVIEGMLIAARVVGARRGFFYIRAEYPLALERVREALEICRQRGLLGDNVLGSGHGFELEVVAGAGAFVCGEETALIAAIEGRRGMPRPRPPYPAEQGLWGRPTLVNNVETYALVPGIVRGGDRSFAALGTARSRGTKCFALAGKIARSGLIEVPMGMTLRQIVEHIGGGIRGGKRLKAIQIGGPSGGCVPATMADTPVDFEALTEAGAMMGSGGLVVLDESDCMVDVARYFMAFTQAESCGRCTFCRIGTARMLEILDSLRSGRGTAGDLERLEELAHTVKSGSLCGLGRTAPNPVLSTLEHFRDEYQAHVEGRCPAGKCRDLVRFAITEACIGCTLCAQNCPVGAIAMQPYEVHAIDCERCTRCGNCREACPVDAVEVE